MVQNNCATASLLPYQPVSGEWTPELVRHLYRRLGYGATWVQVQEGLTKTPSDLVDDLLIIAVNTVQPESPFWSDWTSEDYDNETSDFSDHEQFLKEEWIKRSIKYPFQAKMSLFWHDHFATEKRVYDCNSSMWHYFRLIHEEAFGNFRTMVEQMGINRAMLIYLDGNKNIAEEPNENYARELMELFTMGEGNGYTQTDIEQVARALTGWRMDHYECTPAYFDSNLHDNGIKTIFGQTGSFNYNDVHELIFTVRADQTATYICTKLYQLFVYQEPNIEVVTQLTRTFKDNNWELLPVINQLLKSEHFYDRSLIGSRIKHPIEVMTSVLAPLGIDIEADIDEGYFGFVSYRIRDMGMELFEPPNVAGWPGHRVWLSENALTNRWTYCSRIINSYITVLAKERIRDLAMSITDNSNDPQVITRAMAQHWLGVPLNDDLMEVAELFLRAGIPENYFDDGSWNLLWPEAPDQLINLLTHFIQLPEYQLA